MLGYGLDRRPIHIVCAPTGIGLFQSKLVVEACNGKIEVESKVGKGSTFRVLLPVEQCSDVKMQ